MIEMTFSFVFWRTMKLIKTIELQIEKLREELTQEYMQSPIITPKILKLSTTLDQLLLEELRLRGYMLAETPA
jgi:hypothetical protein